MIGFLFSKNFLNFQRLLQPTVNYLLGTFSLLGFIFYSFIFGVETNMNSIKGIGKKDFVISFAGLFVSLGLSYAGIKILGIQEGVEGLMKVVMLNAQTFFMVSASHVNDLGIGNSEVGRLATRISLILDIFGMVVSFLIFNTLLPILKGDYYVPIIVLGYYVVIFFIGRPLMLVILSYTPEGRRMKESHFIAIILLLLLLSMISIQVGQPLSVFLFALTLPEEPLTTILRERLDTINMTVLLPIFCSNHGLRADFNALNGRSLLIEMFIMVGGLGKFLGTFVSSKLFRIPFWNAITLSLVMACKGFLDLVMLLQFREQGVSSINQPTQSINQSIL